MKNKEDLKKELEGLSPFLVSQKGREDGFRVPQDYFKSLPDEVMDRIREKPVPVAEPKPHWLDTLASGLQSLFQPRYALAFATVAVLVVAGIYLFKGGNGENCPPGQLACIPDEAIENYVYENIDEFDSGLFEQHFVNRDAPSLPDLELEEMEEYLDRELDNIDLDDLEDLL